MGNPCVPSTSKQTVVLANLELPVLLQGLATSAASKVGDGGANEQKVVADQGTEPPIQTQTEVVAGGGTNHSRTADPRRTARLEN